MATPLATRQIDGIRDSLARITASPIFTRAEKQTNFLRYIVEKYLSGDTSSIKEYEIGTAVYQRPESYDPREDPIVRVEASRLRARIREYYTTTGKDDPIQIDLPKGGYLPVFLGLPSAEPEPKPAPQPVHAPAPVELAPVSYIPPAAPLPAEPVSVIRRINPLIWFTLGGAVLFFLLWQFFWKPGQDPERRPVADRPARQSARPEPPPAANDDQPPKADADDSRADSELAHSDIPLKSKPDPDAEPELDDGYAALIRYYRDVEYDLDRVDSTCRSSLKKVTDPVRILVNCAPVESLRGNHSQATRWARDAVRLRPQWEFTWSTQALVYWRAGRTNDAVEAARKAVGVDPNAIGARGILALAAVKKDDMEEAERVLTAGLPPAGIDREDWFSYRGYAAAAAGNKELATRMMQRLQERARSKVVSKASLARIRMGEGDTEAALNLLEEGARHHEIGVAMFLTSPEAQPLKKNPRYQAAVRSLGLKPVR